MPIDPITGALIGGAINTAASVITNSGGRRSQNRANRHNVDFWNMQNDYNNPTSQMARLREAGLNPNLIYGTGGSSAVGNAQGVAPSKAVPQQSPLKDITQFARVGQTSATTDNLKEQNTVLAQEATLKAAQTADIGVKTATSKFDLGLAEELRNTSLQAAQENLRSMEQGTIQKEIENSFQSQAVQARVKQLYYQSQHARESLQGKKLNNAMKQLDIDLKRLGIERNDPWYFRIFGRQAQNIKNTYKQRKNVIKRYENNKFKN